MIEQSLAQPAHQTTTRVERGRQLWEEHGEEITFSDGAWFVPSVTASTPGGTSAYEVRLGRQGNVCECLDFEHWGESSFACKHIYAATIARAKSTICSCCGNRVAWRRFVTEVQEEHDLLSWFVGDRLCADCVHGGYWA